VTIAPDKWLEVALLTPSAKDASPKAQEEQLRADLAAVSGELYERGLLTPSGGNLSAMLPGRSRILITPSGSHKGRLTPEAMVMVGRDGRPPADLVPGVAPSVEAPVHAAIYRSRPDAGAVVHAHPLHATVAATLGLELKPEPAMVDVAAFARTPILPYMPPGSPSLARGVAGALATCDTVLLAGHGAFAVGPSLDAATARMIGLERACELWLLMRRLAADVAFPQAKRQE